MSTDLHHFARRLRERIAQSAATSFATWPDAEFNLLALELFAAQFAANPAYRRFCESRHATPGHIEHWTRVPAVPAAAFKELEFTCLAAADRTHVFHSSGTTTQTPGRHFHSAASLALYADSLWPWFACHVFDALPANTNWRILALTPPPGQAPHSSLVHMFATVQRRAGTAMTEFVGTVASDGAWQVNVGRAREFLARAQSAGEPVVVLGTAFNFVHLLDALAESDARLALPPGSVVMETGGYKGRSRALPREELHTLLTHQLGVQHRSIVCEYGMSELSSQAYAHTAEPETCNPEPGTRHFHFPPWCRAQIISPETGRQVSVGEAGLVRVLDLANAFSVAALQTEDLAVRAAEGFELLGRAAHAEPRGCSLQAA